MSPGSTMRNHGPAFAAFRQWLFAQTSLLWFGAWRLGSWCTAVDIQVLCQAQADSIYTYIYHINIYTIYMHMQYILQAARLSLLSWCPAKVTTASFSPDSTRLVTGSEDCCGRVWDVLLAWLLQLAGFFSTAVSGFVVSAARWWVENVLSCSWAMRSEA